TTPGNLLEGSGTSAGSVLTSFKLSNLGTTNGTGAEMQFSALDDGNTQRTIGAITSAWVNSAAATRTSYLAFSTSNGGRGERMRIDNLGNVGIGTTSPYSRLSVSGSDTSGSTAAMTIAN